MSETVEDVVLGAILGYAAKCGGWPNGTELTDYLVDTCSDVGGLFHALEDLRDKGEVIREHGRYRVVGAELVLQVRKGEPSDTLLRLRAELASRPRIVCLCGSTRFKEEYEQAARDETLAGKIVLSVGMFGHQEGIDMNGPVKAMLDELHLRKIDEADEVLVLNPLCRVCPQCKTVWPHAGIRIIQCGCRAMIGHVQPVGYIGESTRREIAYAQQHGKPVRYLNLPSAEGTTDLAGLQPVSQRPTEVQGEPEADSEGGEL